MALLSGCPPTIPACASPPPDLWPFESTPGTLLTVVQANMACAIILTIAALSLTFAVRRDPPPAWRRSTFRCMVVLVVIALFLAQQAWSEYQPFARLGMPQDASYSSWVNRLDGPTIAHISQIGFTYVVLTVGVALTTLVVVWIAIGQMKHRIRGIHARVPI